MVQDKEMISVINRNSGYAGYPVPDSNNSLWRKFAPGETKKIEAEELRKLMFIPGGDVMLQDYLVILNQELVQELFGEVEPEYFYTATEIENLLKNGTLDQLDDCLTFAPEGVIEMIKTIAVSIKLNDMDKRELIYNKTGYNVHNVITNNKKVEQAEAEMGVKQPEVKVRKAAVPGQTAPTPVQSTQPTTPQRKAAAPKYKVVTKTE